MSFGDAKSCQGCGEPMIFVTTIRKADGRESTWPLDAEPSYAGTWRISENEENEHTGKPKAYYIGKDHPDYKKFRDQKLLHTAHHATCPNAREFKKGR